MVAFDGVMLLLPLLLQPPRRAAPTESKTGDCICIVPKGEDGEGELVNYTLTRADNRNAWHTRPCVARTSCARRCRCVYAAGESEPHCRNGLGPRSLSPVNYRRAGLNKDAVDARNSRSAFHRLGRERRGSVELRTDAAAA